ncbi:Type I phosphodiesterase / nucleotide pyrophosphatase [Streptomyces sp. SolWspMP-sol7th]|uniref:alkaline phosphatase family protein n=1 Tax=Streptomyces sp. SolWspMP-sol7th TaxID=1839776 RepID=UPI00081D9403|nr:alkaline phosphatase family protein [Streptomyces sp. SolWspMP-sol7th]SCD40309.1 Type I phosphodiesterase / nucleotide pyrophosphatase [Streptomyces sp. SolWspMP-sol7th]
MPADSTTGPLSSRSPSRRAVLGGTGAVLLGAALPLSPARAAARTPKVLLLGIDGALLGRTAAAGTPHLDSLRASGVTAQSLLYSEPLAPTLSGPGWSTILTGVWPDKHKVRDNNFTGGRFDLYPDFLTRAERYRPALSTYAVASWNPLTTTVFSPEVDTRVSTPEAEYDTGTTQRAVAALREGNHDAVFVHLDNVDHAGHSYGAASSQYLAALATADAQLGQLLGAVRGRATYAQEDWLLLVTTDHGHTDPGGHGGNTLPERQTFLVASGGGLPPGACGTTCGCRTSRRPRSRTSACPSTRRGGSTGVRSRRVPAILSTRCVPRSARAWTRRASRPGHSASRTPRRAAGASRTPA